VFAVDHNTMQQNAFLAATIGTGAKGGKATGVSGSLCKATPAARAVPLSFTVVPPSSAAGDAAVAAGLEAAEHRAGAAAGARNPAPNAGAKNSSKMQGYLAQGGEADGRRFVGLALTTERGLTKTGERSGQDAWDMWCAYLEQSSIVKEWEGKGRFGQVLKGEVLMKHWMPCASVWLGFHHFVRASVSSYDRYKGILNQVCMRGKQQLFDLMAAQGVVMVPAMLDPQVVYGPADRRMRRIMAKQYKKDVKKVAFITMEEARNGHRFVDPTSALGLSDAGLWNLSCVTGGRRARTYASIKLCDIFEVVVQSVLDDQGTEVLVPSFAMSFADEKYMDDRGQRRMRESFEGWTDIWSHAGLSASFWLYSFLLFRDVFVGGNRLLTAKAGDVLKFKPECLEYYLFCKMEGDVPLDCVPLWPRQVSDSTRSVLKRMGSEPRGHRAHRSGGVSRVCIVNLMENQGKKIDGDVENVSVRWGGWTEKEGIWTMKKVYQSLIIDEYINVTGLAFNECNDPAIWAARLNSFMGKVLPLPAKGIRDLNPGCEAGPRLPWAYRMRALMGAADLRASFAAT
jgi:hypothetical protein